MIIPVRVCYPELQSKGVFKWKNKELRRLVTFIVWEKEKVYKVDYHLGLHEIYEISPL